MIHFEHRILGWGVFFIVLGLVPLAVRSGLVAADLRWWELWPLLLVGWGLSLVLRRTPAAALGGLLVAATFGAMIGGLLAGGFDGGRLGFACGRAEGSAFPTRTGTFAGSEASVGLELSCGDLTVEGVHGTSWSVAGTAPPDRGPEIEADHRHLRVRSAEQPRAFGWLFGGAEAWQVELPTEVALDLSLTLNAGQATIAPGVADLARVSVTLNAGSASLDLDAARLRSLSATVNAGSLVVRLPADDVSGSLTVNAGSIAICAPPGVGLRLVTAENPVGSDGFAEAGLSRSGNVWTNPEYATAPTRIELSTTANAGSISLNDEEACR